MIIRIGRYVRGSYPPAFYLPYALAWSLGMAAAFALADPRIRTLHLDGGTALTALTFGVMLLLARAVDDIRDLDYDQEHNPRRPLASGAVLVPDLVVLVACCAAAALALNARRGGVAIVLAVLLGYTVLLLVVDRTWHWPPGDNLALSGLVSFPVQLMFNLYIYAGVLRQSVVGPSWHAVLPLLLAVTAFTHLEYARKVTRTPRAGERTYVTLYGADKTAAVAVIAAVVSAALALVLTQPWAHGGLASWRWLVLAPLACPGYGAYKFWLRRAGRWPLLAAALFLLSSFAAYLIIGLS